MRPGEATTQYGDVRGECSGDIADQLGNMLRKAAEELGYSGSGYVVGLKLYVPEQRRHETREVGEDCFLTFEVYEPGLPEGGVDALKRQLEEDGGPLPVTNYRTECSITDFLRCFKRFKVALFTRNLPVVDEVEVVEDQEMGT